MNIMDKKKPMKKGVPNRNKNFILICALKREQERNVIFYEGKIITK